MNILMIGKESPWNRCDVCGRFIAYKDFQEGAIHEMVLPDSELSVETFETLCIEHCKPAMQRPATNCDTAIK